MSCLSSQKPSSLNLNPNQNAQKHWLPSLIVDMCLRRPAGRAMLVWEVETDRTVHVPEEPTVEAIGIYFWGTVLPLIIFSPVFFEKLYNHFMLVQFLPFEYLQQNFHSLRVQKQNVFTLRLVAWVWIDL